MCPAPALPSQLERVGINRQGDIPMEQAPQLLFRGQGQGRVGRTVQQHLPAAAPPTRATGAGAGPMSIHPLASPSGRSRSARAVAEVEVALAEGPARRSRHARLNGTRLALRRRAASSSRNRP